MQVRDSSRPSRQGNVRTPVATALGFLLISALLTSCGGPEVSECRKLRVTERPATPIRMHFDGQVVLDVGWAPAGEEEGLVVDMPAAFATKVGEYEFKLDGRLRAEELTPNGWRPTAFSEVRFTGDGEVRVGVVSQGESHVHLLVDNRGQPASELRVGQLKMTARAGEKESFRFRPPHDASNADVHLGDRRIGSVHLDSFADDAGEEHFYETTFTYLIDPTASRSYEFDYMHYSAVGLGPGYDASEEYHSKRLHKIDGTVSYFLARPPRTVGSRGPSMIGWIREL